MPENNLLPYLRRSLDGYSKQLALTSEALGSAFLYVAIVRGQEQTQDAAIAKRLIHELNVAQRDLAAVITKINTLTDFADETTRSKP